MGAWYLAPCCGGLIYSREADGRSHCACHGGWAAGGEAHSRWGGDAVANPIPIDLLLAQILLRVHAGQRLELFRCLTTTPADDDEP